MKRTQLSSIRIVQTKAVFVVVMLVTCGRQASADFIFGPAQNLGPVVNSSSGEGTVSVSADRLEMYFSSNRPGGLGYEDLWVSTRQDVDDPWGPPVNLGPPVDSSYRESYPSVSADGLTLYFSDYFYRPDRPGGVGGHDLWVATRPSRNDPWGEPTNLGAGVNSPVDDEAPSLSHDGLTLIFSSERAGTRGWDDLWMCTRPTTQDPWSQPVNLGPVVNSDFYELYGQLSPDGLMLFFESDRPGGLGGYDIWVTRRKSHQDPWGPPANVGPPINTVGEDGLGTLSADGKTLYFASDRPGGWGSFDMWQAEILPVVDFNGDGNVDGQDLLILAKYWGTDEQLCDIGPMPWGDGVVDLQDLIALADHVGKQAYDPTLIAHWAFDETEGDIAYDGAGGHHGVFEGVPTWQPDGGVIDGALQLDGCDDCIMTPLELDPGAGPFSVFAWVKGGAPGQVIVSQASGPKWLLVGDDGVLATELLPPGGRKALVSEAIIVDGNWHHVGLTWDGLVKTLYVDDMAVAQEEHFSLAALETNLYLGATGPGKRGRAATFFAGLIDDVCIFNRLVRP